MTVVEQLSLNGDNVTLIDGKPLTDRQELAWTMVKARPVTADDVGAALHEARGRHLASTRCTFCSSDGRAVLTSQALRLLVIRRRGGLYEPRDPQEQEQAALTDKPPQGEDDGSFEAFMRGHAG